MPTSKIRTAVSWLLALLLAAFLLCVAPSAGARTLSNDRTLQGTVVSGGHGLAGYQVSLYGSFIQSGPPWMLLGSGTADNAGHFTINYTVNGSWSHDQPVLFVEATHSAAMLASVIGIGLDAPASVVVNERTTVATANAFAPGDRAARPVPVNSGPLPQVRPRPLRSERKASLSRRAVRYNPSA